MNLKDKSIRKLLKDGLLTGRQAAQLVLRDSVEDDHKRPRILSDADVSAIKKGLTSPKDIQEYNGWIQTYQVLYHATSAASGVAGQVTSNIWKSIAILTPIQAVLQLKVTLEDRIPKIVTQAQFDRLQEEAIQEAWEHGFPLGEFISEWLDQEEDGRESPFINQILSGTIPIDKKLNRNERTFLKRLMDPNSDEWSSQEVWSKLKALDAWVKVKDLRAAGYPMDWLDKVPNHAIIQEPGPDEVDENGDFCGPSSNLDQLIQEGLPSLRAWNELLNVYSPKELAAPIWNQNVKEGVGYVLAIKEAVEIASDMIGVDLAEDLRSMWEEIEGVLDIYNRQIAQVQPHVFELLSEKVEIPSALGFGKAELEIINPEKLKPSAKSRKEIRDQVAVGLGRGWWKNIKSVEEEGEELVLVSPGGDDGQGE